MHARVHACMRSAACASRRASAGAVMPSAPVTHRHHAPLLAAVALATPCNPMRPHARACLTCPTCRAPRAARSYVRKYESGGSLWPCAAHRLLACLLVGALFSGCALAVKGAYVQPSLTFLVAPTLLARFYAYCNNRCGGGACVRACMPCYSRASVG